MILNLLHPATSNLEILAWENFIGKLHYDATPLGPLGISVIMHNRSSRQKYWDMRGKDVWIIRVSLKYYRY